MKHKVVRVDNLMYDGCEPHWKCVQCGICIPFHCFTKEQIEQMDCKDEQTTATKYINLEQCTKKDLLEIENYAPEEKFNGVVIVPTNNTHSSGWRSMKYILVNGERIVGSLGGGSDVLHINGIGGFGYGADLDDSIKSGTVKRVAYKIDCLNKSGCLRLFADHWLTLGDDYLGTSDFMVYAGDRIK